MRKNVGIACILMLGAFCGFEIYYSSGIVGVTRKPNHVFATPGCICHDQNTNVRVWISGPESLATGQRGLYTVSVAKQSNIAAGFNVAAYFGELGVQDTVGTQAMSPFGNDTLELTHINSKLASGRDTISWSFWYRAPQRVGVLDTIYSCGNSVDTSQDPGGDAWNFGQDFLVRITGTNSVEGEPLANSYRLLQNYPNPFNPSTVIRYETPVEARVEVAVFDATGREVRTLVNEEQRAGLHEVLFDAASVRQLSSGVYLYRITMSPVQSKTAKPFVDVKKMLLVR
jgi:hypothetical protein